MFARLQEFRCTHCDIKFIGAEINHCSYHPNVPSFPYQSNYGSFPCCNSKATRFESISKVSGCTSLNHRIKYGSPRKTVANRGRNFEMLMEHFKIACEPFYFEKHNIFTDEIEKKVKYADLIDEDKSLLNLVLQFVK